MTSKPFKYTREEAGIEANRETSTHDQKALERPIFPSSRLFFLQSQLMESPMIDRTNHMSRPKQMPASTEESDQNVVNLEI